MDTKLIQVFYGENYLPYSDITRTTNFPIVGNVMLGSNNVCKIKFYVDYIGGVANTSWVAITKLPNGKDLYEVLENKGQDENGEFVLFDISSHYTNIKGNITISLSGYEGEIQLIQDEETGLYEIYGNPLITATGSIRLAINYTVQIISKEKIPFSELQMLLAYVASKNDIYDSIVVLDTAPLSLLSYRDGQLFYLRSTNTFYILNNNVLQPYNVLDALTVESSDYVIPMEDR